MGSAADLFHQVYEAKKKGILSEAEAQKFNRIISTEGPSEGVTLAVQMACTAKEKGQKARKIHLRELLNKLLGGDHQLLKRTAIALVCFILFLGFFRIYYGGGVGIQLAMKGGFSFKDTIVNMDNIFGMPRLIISMQHPSVMKQIQEKGWVKTDEQLIEDMGKEFKEAMSGTNSKKKKMYFPVSNFSYKSGADGTTNFIGEIHNINDESFNTALFNLLIYDSSGNLLSVEAFVINNFESLSFRSFSVYSLKKFPSNITYRVELNSGY
ncbi:MAG: hypothetical protein EOM12_08780 [Verrucomicrobiae bacterium]|nr:hypothetical protein [Verrucomicrobiae bacterium]